MISASLVALAQENAQLILSQKVTASTLSTLEHASIVVLAQELAQQEQLTNRVTKENDHRLSGGHFYFVFF